MSRVYHGQTLTTSIMIVKCWVVKYHHVKYCRNCSNVIVDFGNMLRIFRSLVAHFAFYRDS
jgi:hypothetical protein